MNIAGSLLERLPGRADIAGAEVPRRLMEDHQNLVRSLAWRICRTLPPSVEVDDLIAWGQVGLAEAAWDFDPSRGNRFSTYAYYRIRGSILDGLARMGWFHGAAARRIRAARLAGEALRLDAQDGGEGAAATLEDGVRWFRGITSTLALVYLTALSGEDGDGGEEGEPGIEDRSAARPEALVLEEEAGDRVRTLVEALPGDAGGLIKAVYFEGLTLEEAGERIGISKGWASRLHTRTLQRLARSLRQLGLEG